MDGEWAFDPDADVALIASIERHRASGKVGLGLVAGFGLSRHGRSGRRCAHDSHNLIVAGTNPRDMLACVRALAEAGGGFVVVDPAARSGPSCPLPVAGLLSTADADTVCDQLDEVHRAARSLGCPLDGAVRHALVPGPAGDPRSADHRAGHVRRQDTSNSFMSYLIMIEPKLAMPTIDAIESLAMSRPDGRRSPSPKRPTSNSRTPTWPRRRSPSAKWGTRDIAALWISMSACIPTYMLASSLIAEGMNWWQAVLTIFLGNTIVLIPMILNAHAGTQVRHSVPGLLPGVVRHPRARTCRPCSGRWWPAAGSASRPGSAAGRSTRSSPIYIPSWQTLARCSAPGYQRRRSWAASSRSGRVNMLVIYRGHRLDPHPAEHQGAAPDHPRAWRLLAWAYRAADGFGPMLTQPSQFARAAQGRQVLDFFFPALTGDGRLLGDAVAQHPRLLPLRPHPARPGPRPGARPADDDGPVLVHRRGRHVGDGRHLRRGDLGPGRAPGRVPEPRGADRGDASLSAWRPWRRTSPPTSSAPPTTSPTSGPDGSPSAPAA